VDVFLSAFVIGRNVIVRSRIGKISSSYVSMKGRQSERVFPLLVGRGNHNGSPSKESEAPVFGRRGFRDHHGRPEVYELVKRGDGGEPILIPFPTICPKSRTDMKIYPDVFLGEIRRNRLPEVDLPFGTGDAI
jgi:hypothetical protein